MEYVYKFRLGYGSDENLIEIVNAEQFNGVVFNVFLDAIKELSPSNVNANLDLALRTDDFEAEFSTSAGKFLFAQDFWGFIFIHSLDKESDIWKVEQVLILTADNICQAMQTVSAS